MSTIIIQLDPRKLNNPDLDIRYVLPDLLAERSEGILSDDGYDYSGDVPHLLIFLKATDLDRGLRYVLDVLEHEEILENNLLQSVVVATEREGSKEVVYPKNFQGSFPN